MIIKYIHLLRILISLRAIDVLPVVNLLLYNRNTLYTYNFYSYIFDRCYQLLPHDSMTAATAELGLEVSEDEGEEEDEDEVEDKVEEFFA